MMYLDDFWGNNPVLDSCLQIKRLRKSVYLESRKTENQGIVYMYKGVKSHPRCIAYKTQLQFMRLRNNNWYMNLKKPKHHGEKDQGVLLEQLNS